MSFNEDLYAKLHQSPDQVIWDYKSGTYTLGDVARFADEIIGLLSQAGVPADASIGLIMRNRPLQSAAMLGLIAGDRPLTTIYAFQAPALLAKDIISTRFAAVIADAEDWVPEVIEAARATSTVAIRLSLNDTPQIEHIADTPCAVGDDYHQILGEPALEVLSSGTTGKPKRIRFPFRMLVRAVDGQLASMVDSSFPTDINSWPFAGIGMANLVAGMMLHRPMAMLDRFNVPEWVEAVKKHKPSFVTGPPAVAQMVVDANVPPEDIASVKYFYGGSAPISPELVDILKQRYGIATLWAYGATEFCGTIVSWSLPLYEEFGETKKGSMGKPLPGIEVRVVDTETGEPLPTGRRGYLEAIVPAVGPDWIHTTDLAEIDEDGFIFHRGRGDGAILRGGFKVLPEMIVSALLKHPTVFDAGVVGLPDARLGAVPVAAVQLKSDAEATSPEDLLAFLRGELASTYIPAQIIIVDVLPRTPSLKIDQTAVKALFA